MPRKRPCSLSLALRRILYDSSARRQGQSRCAAHAKLYSASIAPSLRKRLLLGSSTLDYNRRCLKQQQFIAEPGPMEKERVEKRKKGMNWE